MARQFKLLGRQERMDSQLRIAVSLLTFPNTNECIPSQLYFFFLDYSNGPFTGADRVEGIICYMRGGHPISKTYTMLREYKEL